MAQLDVSLIIVNWNTRHLLRNCIESIFEQAGNVDYEVIVVDNASTDGSAEMVKKNFQEVILLENSKNRGFAAANNQAIAIARGKYILLLNSDTVVLDKAIERVISFADSHPKAAVIGCRVLNPDKTLQPTCFMFPSILNMLLSSTYLYKLFPKSKFFGREGMTWWDRNDAREVEVVKGCFMLVRREALNEVGVMDEQFFMYAEETDWCYRFHKAGWEVLYTPSAEIIHYGGVSSQQIKPQMLLQLRGSMLIFLRKHRGRLVHALACLFVSMFFLLRIPYWLARAIVSNRDWASHLQTARLYTIGSLRAILGGRGLCIER